MGKSATDFEPKLTPDLSKNRNQEWPVAVETCMNEQPRTVQISLDAQDHLMFLGTRCRLFQSNFTFLGDGQK